MPRPCVFGLSALAVRIPAQAVANGSANSIQALFVSDIHFEPFRDPGKAVQLAAAPVGEWDRILAAPASADAAAQWTKTRPGLPHARCRHFLRSLSIELACHPCAGGEAKFVILSGDLIAHNFSCKFAAVFPKATPADYKAFVEKTIDYDLANLRAALPGVPVYAALGNNDSDCGDYQLDPNSAFLKESGQDFAADFVGSGKGAGAARLCRRRLLQREPSCAG